MKIFHLIIALLFTTSLNIFADVIPDNSKRVRYNFSVKNADEFKNHVFVVYPVNTSNGRPVYEMYILGEASEYYCSGRFGTPVVFGIEKEKFDETKLLSLYNPDDLDKNENALMQYLNSNYFVAGEISTVNLVPRGADFSSVKDTYALSETEESFKLELTERIYLDSEGNIIRTDDGSDGFDSFDSSINLKYIMIIFSCLSLMTILFILFRRKAFSK